MPLILPKTGYYEMEEKKSKFIGHCAPVHTVDEAKAFIEAIRRQHKDANHNVFAYSVTEGNIIRFNDDGEPSGTAGMPVLNVYDKTGIINWVCVVTRYFGGTLLGAGGLVRAYSKAAKGAMTDAGPEELIIYTMHTVTCAYSNHDRVKYNFDKAGFQVLEWIYTDQCQAIVRIREDQFAEFSEGLFYTYEDLQNEA
ncbi:MAG: YigZ family protein [Defluviitaleaceae bacterium]|nr:YigZ family protein [Defluviitaleaceae bacterium]